MRAYFLRVQVVVGSAGWGGRMGGVIEWEDRWGDEGGLEGLRF